MNRTNIVSDNFKQGKFSEMDYHGIKIETTIKGDEKWFKAHDITAKLGYENSSRITAHRVLQSKVSSKNKIRIPLGKNSCEYLVNEDGFRELIKPLRKIDAFDIRYKMGMDGFTIDRRSMKNKMISGVEVGTLRTNNGDLFLSATDISIGLGYSKSWLRQIIRIQNTLTPDDSIIVLVGGTIKKNYINKKIIKDALLTVGDDETRLFNIALDCIDNETNTLKNNKILKQTIKENTMINNTDKTKLTSLIATLKEITEMAERLQVLEDTNRELQRKINNHSSQIDRIVELENEIKVIEAYSKDIKSRYDNVIRVINTKNISSILNLIEERNIA